MWEASKAVGKVVAPELKELVGLRNAAAKKLGFANYHALSLYLNEQNGDDLIKLFDRLDELTREPFRRAKAEIDAVVRRVQAVGASAHISQGELVTVIGAIGDREHVANLEGAHVLPGCGHWTQQERPAEVNALLLPWLTSLKGRVV